MIEKNEKDDILKSISLTGAASEENAESNQIVIGSINNINHIIDSSSGRKRIRTNVIKRFNLTLSIPELLRELSPFEIRCCLCRKVISYPCWYYSIRYAINHFHFFVCFNAASPEKPTTKCYRR